MKSSFRTDEFGMQNNLLFKKSHVNDEWLYKLWKKWISQTIKDQERPMASDKKSQHLSYMFLAAEERHWKTIHLDTAIRTKWMFINRKAGICSIVKLGCENDNYICMPITYNCFSFNKIRSLHHSFIFGKLVPDTCHEKADNIFQTRRYSNSQLKKMKKHKYGK